MSADNPLLTESPLPYRLPPFADVTLEHCREAVLAGMAEQARHEPGATAPVSEVESLTTQ